MPGFTVRSLKDRKYLVCASLTLFAAFLLGLPSHSSGEEKKAAPKEITVTVDDGKKGTDFKVTDKYFDSWRPFNANHEDGVILINDTTKSTIQELTITLKDNPLNYDEKEPKFKFIKPKGDGPFGPFKKVVVSDDGQTITFSGAEVKKGGKFHLLISKFEKSQPYFKGKVSGSTEK